MKKETWKTIEDYPDYEVSSLGRVRLITKHIIYPYKSSYGNRVWLYDKDENLKSFNVKELRNMVFQVGADVKELTQNKG